MKLRLFMSVIVLALWMPAQSIEVTPNRVLVDEPVAIRVTGLSPSERVTIQSELVDGGGHHWTAHAEFVADASGAIDVSKQAPVAGSYKEISGMGLIWSMMPQEKDVQQYLVPKDLGPQTTEFRLMRKNEGVATAKLEQLNIGHGVQRLTVKDEVLRGILYVPSKQPAPGVLVLGGSNGGAPLRQAAWLASHGYTALALGYFRYQDLPPVLESIPLEYFARALAWMSKVPQVQFGSQGLAVMGTSRGGELALQLGSMFPPIHAVVAYVPANVRYPGCCAMNAGPAWTWKGQALAYIRGNMEMKSRAAIQVEATQGPVLMLSGEDDHVWSSSSMADDVVSRLKHSHFAYSFENLKYPHAGHSAGRPAIQPTWHSGIRHPVSGREMFLGGSPKGDAESSLDAIPKVLAFLKSWSEPR